MKKIYFKKTKTALQLLTLLMTLFAFTVHAQCPTGSVTFNTQAQVNAFAASYPNCTQISGDLEIGIGGGTTDITNLTALSNITTVTGNIFLSNSPITNVNGLNNITSIGGSLQVSVNTNLTNLNLTGLSNVVSTVNITNNPSLTNLSFTSLTTIGGTLSITNNAALTNLNGLNNLANIAKGIYFANNALLNNVSALQNTTVLPTASGGLTVFSNPSLAVCNISSFCSYLANPATTHPRYIFGNLTTCLNETAVITACSQPVVTIPDANFKTYLLGVAAINTNGDNEIQVSEATAFTGQILCQFKNISDLTGIQAFVNITKLDCGGNALTNLDVSNNTLLQTLLLGSNNLTTLDLSLNTALITFACNSNPLLNTLNIKNGNNTALTTMIANINPSLTCIQVDNVANATAYSGWIKNATASYNTNCSALATNDITKNLLSIYPNPTKDVVNIANLDIVLTSIVTVADLNGRIVKNVKFAGVSEAQINISELSAGIYIMTVSSDKGFITKKIIKN